MKKDLTLSWQHRETIFKTWKCPKLIVLLFIAIKQRVVWESWYFQPTHEGWEKHPQFPKRRFLWSIQLLLLCPTDFRPIGHPWLHLNPASVILRGLFTQKNNSYTEGRLPSLTTPIWEKKKVGWSEAFYLTWLAGQPVMAVVTAVCALHTQWELQGTCSRAAAKGGGSRVQVEKNSNL